MKRVGLLLLLCFTFACKSSTSFSPEDQRFVDLTLALLRVKSQGLDSVRLIHSLDAQYRKFGLPKKAYIMAAENYAQDPTKTNTIYSAIRDSLRIK